MKKILVSDFGDGLPLIGKYFDFVTCISRDVCLAIHTESIEFNRNTIDYIRSKGIPMIGTPRIDKINQVHVLRRYGINHPVSFFNEVDNTCLNTTDKLNAYCDLDQFVVKPIMGARGIGVKLIERNDYKECLRSEDRINVIFSDPILSKDPNPSGSSDYYSSSSKYPEHRYVIEHIGNMIIQEPIKVKREFRCLYFAHDEIVSYEREKSNGQFCGNLSHGAKPKNVDGEYFNSSIRPFVEKFKPIMEEFKYPWLSIDVYEDMDGNLGCFEFQMEFAYEGFDHKKIRKLMKEAVEHFIPK